MSDDDISLSEKRVYADADDATTVFVATELGVARVSISDDIVGEFSLEYRGSATGVVSAGGRLAVATPDDVLVGTERGFRETEFGSASAVGHSDGFVAAGEGRIARFDGTWETLSELDGVRSIDGAMAAAESGVHRLDGTHVGLDDACDVSTAGTPLAATRSGLYYLANGWMRAFEGECSVVASDGERAHAVADGELYVRGTAPGAWRPVDLPVEGTIVDIAYGDGIYAVTRDGTVLADAGDGWRYRSIGLTGARELAVL